MQVEPIRNFFAALFLASIGMLIHVHFLWNHVDILLASVLLVVIVKTIVISVTVKGFGYNNKTSLLVRSYLISFTWETTIFFQISISMFPLDDCLLCLPLCRWGCLQHKQGNLLLSFLVELLIFILLRSVVQFQHFSPHFYVNFASQKDFGLENEYFRAPLSCINDDVIVLMDTFP